jgi:hypothetical protein
MEIKSQSHRRIEWKIVLTRDLDRQNLLQKLTFEQIEGFIIQMLSLHIVYMYQIIKIYSIKLYKYCLNKISAEIEKAKNILLSHR